ncbi:hypothetical protein HELRODRAFT_163007 [Helobdella robusta]|uniref:Uncharacterized protein n=1 Tax=Helobdella robusta TaxID=6412 RepID=T1ETJ9_HELRO|nr:hypothetical protein HELRODRAFT_163007 [Helobdella robusta]ESN99459.1 hypothetical protein HELRODRAFT_163007 [Helobdella robusta]
MKNPLMTKSHCLKRDAASVDQILHESLQKLRSVKLNKRFRNKSTLNPNNKKSKLIIKDEQSNKLITDENVICEKFNGFFADTVKEFSVNNSSNNNSFAKYLGDSQTDSFFLTETNESEIYSIIKNFKNSKSSDIHLRSHDLNLMAINGAQLNIGARNISDAGPTLWNALPKSLPYLFSI